MASETPENPIEITDCIKTTLCLENYKEKYLFWEREIFDVVRDHGLQDFFFGTNLPSIPSGGTTTVEFEHWKKNDKAIWNWLFSTLAPDIQSNLGQMAQETTNMGQLAHATTHLLWKFLRSMYSTDPLPSEFNLEDPPFIAKTSTRSSRTPENPTNLKISSTSENPIQMNHPTRTPINQENFPQWEPEVLQGLGSLGLQDSLDGPAQYAPPSQQVTSTYAGPSQPSAPSPPKPFPATNGFPSLAGGLSQCEICFRYGHTASNCYYCYLEGLGADEPPKEHKRTDQAHVQNGAGSSNPPDSSTWQTILLSCLEKISDVVLS